MKKLCLSVLILGLAIALCACSKTTITMQEICDANLAEALLENHESVHAQNKVDGELVSETYLSKDYIYDVLYGWTTFLTDHSYYTKSDDVCQRIFLISPDGLADVASYRAEKYASPFLSSETLLESIQSITKKGDRINVTSVLEQEQVEVMALEDEGLISGDFEYELEAKTCELISVKGVYDYDDETLEIVSDVFYDGELPEGANVFLEYDRQTEDMRTITLIFNPGSENEKNQSIQAPKGLPVGLVSAHDADGAFELYDDAACAQVHTASEEHTSDITLYVKWGE